MKIEGKLKKHTNQESVESSEDEEEVGGCKDWSRVRSTGII